MKAQAINKRVSGQTRTAVIASLILHITAFIVLAAVRLYYGELDVKEQIPVAFVERKDTKLLRRSALVRPMVSISRSPQNISQEQAIAHPAYSSSEVFYTDAPAQTFSVARSIEREGFSGQIIAQLPPIRRSQYVSNPIGARVIKETHPPGMQIQPRIASGHDFLSEMPSMQEKPSLGDIMQRFARTVRRKIESKKRYPLTARKSMIEGRVGVKMTILKDGRLETVEIIESSGYTILDKEALASVRRSAPFPSFPKEAERKRIQMSIYLVFKIV